MLFKRILQSRTARRIIAPKIADRLRRVIGTAGSDMKCALARQHGADYCITNKAIIGWTGIAPVE